MIFLSLIRPNSRRLLVAWVSKDLPSVFSNNLSSPNNSPRLSIESWSTTLSWVLWWLILIIFQRSWSLMTTSKSINWTRSWRIRTLKRPSKVSIQMTRNRSSSRLNSNFSRSSFSRLSLLWSKNVRKQRTRNWRLTSSNWFWGSLRTKSNFSPMMCSNSLKGWPSKKLLNSSMHFYKSALKRKLLMSFKPSILKNRESSQRVFISSLWLILTKPRLFLYRIRLRFQLPTRWYNLPMKISMSRIMRLVFSCLLSRLCLRKWRNSRCVNRLRSRKEALRCSFQRRERRRSSTLKTMTQRTLP